MNERPKTGSHKPSMNDHNWVLAAEADISSLSSSNLLANARSCGNLQAAECDAASIGTH